MDGVRMFVGVGISYFILVCVFTRISDGQTIILPEGDHRNYSDCYLKSMTSSCDQGDIIIVENVRFGTKPNNGVCSVTYDTTEPSTCCQLENEDCTYDHQSTVFYEQCSGRVQCIDDIFIPNALNTLPDTCDISMYHFITQFLHMDYYCVSDDRIGSLCNSISISQTNGKPYYVQNRGYPNPIPVTDTDCACSVETDVCNSTISMYMIHNELSGSPGGCGQSFTLDYDGVTETYACADNTWYNLTEKQTASTYLRMSFNNAAGLAAGYLWIGFQNEYRLLINCPPKTQQYCLQPTTSTTSTTTTSTTSTTTTPTTSTTTTSTTSSTTTPTTSTTTTSTTSSTTTPTTSTTTTSTTSSTTTPTTSTTTTPTTSTTSTPTISTTTPTISTTSTPSTSTKTTSTTSTTTAPTTSTTITPTISTTTPTISTTTTSSTSTTTTPTTSTTTTPTTSTTTPTTSTTTSAPTTSTTTTTPTTSSTTPSTSTTTTALTTSLTTLPSISITSPTTSTITTSIASTTTTPITSTTTTPTTSTTTTPTTSTTTTPTTSTTTTPTTSTTTTPTTSTTTTPTTSTTTTPTTSTTTTPTTSTTTTPTTSTTTTPTTSTTTTPTTSTTTTPTTSTTTTPTTSTTTTPTTSTTTTPTTSTTTTTPTTSTTHTPSTETTTTSSTTTASTTSSTTTPTTSTTSSTTTPTTSTSTTALSTTTRITSTTTTTTQTPTSTTSNSSTVGIPPMAASSEDDNNNGYIVAIVIGGMILVSVFVVLVCFWCYGKCVRRTEVSVKPVNQTALVKNGKLADVPRQIDKNKKLDTEQTVRSENDGLVALIPYKRHVEAIRAPLNIETSTAATRDVSPPLTVSRGEQPSSRGETKREKKYLITRQNNVAYSRTHIPKVLNNASKSFDTVKRTNSRERTFDSNSTIIGNGDLWTNRVMSNKSVDFKSVNKLSNNTNKCPKPTLDITSLPDETCEMDDWYPPLVDESSLDNSSDIPNDGRTVKDTLKIHRIWIGFSDDDIYKSTMDTNTSEV